MKINPRKLLLGALSGLLFCLSFPKWNLWFLSWGALVPLLAAVRGLDFKRAFFVGWFTGWVAFCGILSWIVPTFRAAGVPLVVGILATALLSGYIGIFFGLFVGIFQRFFRSFSPMISIACASALWVSLEYLRGHLFGGFPWGLLGYSQWKVTELIQVCEWTGIYGLSAALVFSNAFLYAVGNGLRDVRKLVWVGALAGFFIIANFVLREKIRAGGVKEIRVAVLQGNIDQYKKWSPEFVREILGVYGRLCEGAKSAELILWPETAVPGWVPQDKLLLRWIENTVKKTGVHNLIGAVTEKGNRRYNSAFLFGPDGKILDRYDKMHLVPFGEFVPLQSFWGRWIPVLNQLGGFDAGEKVKIIDTPRAKIGAGICYEAIFPELARAQVAAGAEILVNITNDGWYLDTAAPEQHFAMNVFRAVENRRTLIRAANTGISGFIQPDGKMEQTELNKEMFLTGVVVPDSDRKTFYTRHGDLFAQLCCAVALVGIGVGMVRRRKAEGKQA